METSEAKYAGREKMTPGNTPWENYFVRSLMFGAGKYFTSEPLLYFDACKVMAERHGPSWGSCPWYEWSAYSAREFIEVYMDLAKEHPPK